MTGLARPRLDVGPVPRGAPADDAFAFEEDAAGDPGVDGCALHAESLSDLDDANRLLPPHVKSVANIPTEGLPCCGDNLYSDVMKKLIATIALALGVAAIPAVASAAPARHKPTAREVKIYQCTIHHGADAGCDAIPGVWNAWAGRVTPVRWDPCVPGTSNTLFYFQECGPMTPTIKQWCTLNLDHRYPGRELCP